MKLNINNWIKVPKLGNRYFQVSEVFDDGIAVKEHDEKIQYDDICPIEFGGRDLIFNGFEEAWDFGLTWHDYVGAATTNYSWVKEIVPGTSYCKVSVQIDDYGKKIMVYYHGINEPGQLCDFKDAYFHELQNAFITIGQSKIADALKPRDYNIK